MAQRRKFEVVPLAQVPHPLQDTMPAEADNNWKELYRAALLESGPDQVRECIRAARAAMAQRTAEMQQQMHQGAANTRAVLQERQEIADALSGLLRLWERTKFRTRANNDGAKHISD